MSEMYFALHPPDRAFVRSGLLLAAAAATFLLASVVGAAVQDDSAPKLFQAADIAATDLTPEQQKILQALRSQKTTADIQFRKIDTAAFDTSNIELNLTQGASPLATRTSVDVKNQVMKWAGKVYATPQDALFVVRQNNVTGTIQTKDAMYLIRPLGGGLHAVVKQDPSKMPPEHPPEYDRREKARDQKAPAPRNKADHPADTPPAGATAAGAETSDAPAARATAPNPILKVLVAYTPAVDEANADVLGLIDLAERESNLIYQNSKIELTLEVVKTVKVNYTESDSFDTDLMQLKTKCDGVMDDIHTLRDISGADVVVLLINNGAYCGLADRILADVDSAFACVYYQCATGYYSFAHEIGHLQGARHNPEKDDSDVPFPYGHGFLMESQMQRTVMAYECDSGMCRRMPYFSNPDVNLNGVRLGTPERNNNARALNETASLVTRFRP